jgi:hypothetical protein
VETYLADVQLASDPKGAEQAYKEAVEAGVPAAALGYAGLAEVAKREHRPYKPYLDDAIQVGSRSAPVYLEAAEGLSGDQAMELLKKAASLNPFWAEPVYRQAQLVSAPAEREALLRKCTELNPRKTEYWVELAQLQAVDGHGTAAQGTWLRAEQAAPTEMERDRIHQLRVQSEEARLNAEEAERRRQQEAVQAEDDRALHAEAARIHAAERRANRHLSEQSGTAAGANVVPWNELTEKKLQGSITNVHCTGGSATLSIRSRGGNTTKLLLADRSRLVGLSCGVQSRPLRVTVAYSEHADPQSGTAGEIVSLSAQ